MTDLQTRCAGLSASAELLVCLGFRHRAYICFVKSCFFLVDPDWQSRTIR